MNGIEGRVSQANGRLKAAAVGVSIEVKGERLYLRATLPPKPNTHHTKPFQQRLALGYHANPAGVKLAEAEARKVGALLDCKQFSWEPYLKVTTSSPQTVGDWIERFEEDYFQRRKKTPQSETTWRTEYVTVFNSLPANEVLTSELLRRAIVATEPDTRTRKRFVEVSSKLAQFADLETNFKPLKGKYSPQRVSPRDLPNDRLIAKWFDQISDRSWRWAYGMLATYGLRNHELFHLDFSRLPVLTVLDPTKTGTHRVYPIYPEWFEKWDLQSVSVPQCTGKDNSALGNRVSHAFARLEIPFNAYDLRHCWAVRSMEFGLDVSLAAAQMGHSVQVHCQIYHHWISEEVHQRAYEALMMRPNRPRPPE